MANSARSLIIESSDSSIRLTHRTMKHLFCLLALGLSVFASSRTGLKVVNYVTGLGWSATGIFLDPSDPTREFVTLQNGHIRVIRNGALLTTDFLNIEGQVSTDTEQGLLGLAFPPDYAATGYFYIYYTDPNWTIVISRYKRLTNDPPTADPNSAQIVLTIPHPLARNHNGGTLRFGRDGMLWIATGDGGRSYDPDNNSQNLDALLGKFLRIDPSRDDFPQDPNRNYGIPPDNPFVGVPGADEVWSFGWRNPWKWSFDDDLSRLGTGALIVGDVGQARWEEIDYEPAGRMARNYGWRVYEGYQATGLDGGSPPFWFPIYAFSRIQAQAIIGGYVYRGTMLGADFFGRYFCADWIYRKLYSMKLTVDQTTGEASRVANLDLWDHTTEAGMQLGNPGSVDIDKDGELYIVDHTGERILKIVPNQSIWITGLTPDPAGALIGGIREALISDDRYLVLYPVLSGPIRQSFQGILDVSLTTDVATPNSFDVALEAHINQPIRGSLKVAFRNWSTGLFEYRSETFETSVDDRIFSIVGIPASPYRRTDGRVEMRLHSYPAGPALSPDFRTSFDQIRVDLAG